MSCWSTGLSPRAQEDFTTTTPFRSVFPLRGLTEEYSVMNAHRVHPLMICCNVRTVVPTTPCGNVRVSQAAKLLTEAAQRLIVTAGRRPAQQPLPATVRQHD